MSKIKLFNVKIIEVEKISYHTVLMKLCGRKNFSAVPGQFVNIQIDDPLTSSLFLRRPFAVHYIYDESKTFKILFRIKGRGTKRLAMKKPGDSLNLLGPCGKGFKFKQKQIKRVTLLAGGIGIAPYPLLIKHLVKSSKKVDLYYGESDKKFLVQYYHWEHRLLRTFISTENGSEGYKGTVLDLFLSNIKRFDLKYDMVYACGPFAMLYELSKKCPFRLQVLLETVMACGFGVCKACTVPGIEGKPLQVCKHGPVFYSDEIDWERLKKEWL
jgi:dihydroorotate dehydrogenase electron transfer subunit